MKMVSLKQPYNQTTESLLYPQHTQLLGNVAWKTKKNLRTRNDLSMEMHSNEGESVSTYPRRP